MSVLGNDPTARPVKADTQSPVANGSGTCIAKPQSAFISTSSGEYVLSTQLAAAPVNRAVIAVSRYETPLHSNAFRKPVPGVAPVGQASTTLSVLLRLVASAGYPTAGW
jgi:hypothetical protein